MKKLDARIRTTEIDELSDALLKLYANEAALQDEAYLKPVFTEMAAVSDKITEAIRQDKIYSDLEDADALRDAAAMKIFKIVDGYSAVPLEVVSQPAERLGKILQKFTGLTRKAYNEETSLIEALLTDLSSTDATADISLLNGLSEAVALLRQTQDSFMEKRVQYSTLSSEQKYEDTASALKKPLLVLINDRLLPYLTLMKVQDAGKYGHFADTVAGAVDAVNTNIKTRSKKPELKV